MRLPTEQQLEAEQEFEVGTKYVILLGLGLHERYTPKDTK